jgi:hypothetical protein
MGVIHYLKTVVPKTHVDWSSIVWRIAEVFDLYENRKLLKSFPSIVDGKLQAMPEAAQLALKKELDRPQPPRTFSAKAAGLWAWYHCILAYNTVNSTSKVQFPHRIQMRLWTGTDGKKPSGHTREAKKAAQGAGVAVEVPAAAVDSAVKEATAPLLEALKGLTETVAAMKASAAAAHQAFDAHFDDDSDAVDVKAGLREVEAVKTPTLPTPPLPTTRVDDVEDEGEPQVSAAQEPDSDVGPDFFEKGKWPAEYDEECSPSEQERQNLAFTEGLDAEIQAQGEWFPIHQDPHVAAEFGPEAASLPDILGKFHVIGQDPNVGVDNAILVSDGGQTWLACSSWDLPAVLLYKQGNCMADAASDASPTGALASVVLPYRTAKNGTVWFAVLDDRIRIPDPNKAWNPTSWARPHKEADFEKVLSIRFEATKGEYGYEGKNLAVGDPRKPATKAAAGGTSSSGAGPVSHKPTLPRDQPDVHRCAEGSKCRLGANPGHCVVPPSLTKKPDSATPKGGKAGPSPKGKGNNQAKVPTPPTPSPKGKGKEPVRKDPVAESHPLREKGTSRVAALAVEDVNALKVHFNLATDPIPEEEWANYSKEERGKFISGNTVPRWAATAVAIDRRNLQKILKGEITKENFSKVVPTPSGTQSNTAQSAWLDVKSKFPEVALLAKPQTDKEKALRKAWDGLRKRFGDDPALPKLRGGRPTSPGPTSSAIASGSGGSGAGSNAFAASLAPLLEMAKLMGQLKKALA